MLEERPLDAHVHACAQFDCGNATLNDYLRHYAGQHRRHGISRTYVLVDQAAPKVVLGYYCLSPAQIDVARLTEAHRRRLPRYPIPCFRLGRLACRLDRQGEGIGGLLIGCAIERCLRAREEVAGYAVIVDAKDDRAGAFYEHYGFTPCTDQPHLLYLPLGK